jgi:hypothetical protein
LLRGSKRCPVTAAVVVIVTVALLPVEPGTRDVGETLQLALLGAPVQAKLTTFPKVPPTLARLIEYVAAEPAFTVLLLGEAERLKSEAVPPRVTTCGLLLALSFTVKEPE